MSSSKSRRPGANTAAERVAVVWRDFGAALARAYTDPIQRVTQGLGSPAEVVLVRWIDTHDREQPERVRQWLPRVRRMRAAYGRRGRRG